MAIMVFLDGPIAGQVIEGPKLPPEYNAFIPKSLFASWMYGDEEPDIMEEIPSSITYHHVMTDGKGEIGLYSMHSMDATKAILYSLREWVLRYNNSPFVYVSQQMKQR